MKTSTRILSALTLSALALASPSAKATTVYALTNGGNILTFNHTTPGTTTTVTPDPAIVGAYNLLAIDIRPTVQAAPSNPGAGTLWAIGRSGTSFQLFVINPATGATSLVGVPYAAGIDSNPGINTWGFDFDPSTDRIRLVDSATPSGGFSNNYLLNPNAANGVVTQQDVTLSFIGSDPNAGQTPQVDGAAYTTTVFGGTTSLYFLDTNLNALLKAVNITNGTVQTVGTNLGVAVDEPNGFDIYQSLALFSVPTAGGSALYSVNLTSGLATLVGNFAPGTSIRGLAISISDPVPPPGPPILHVFGKDRRTVRTTPATVRGQASDDSGVVALSYRVANRSPSFSGAPFANPFSIKVRRLAFGNNRVIIRAIDPDGNIVQKKLTIVRR